MKNLKEVDVEKSAFEFCKEPLEQVLKNNTNSEKIYDAFGLTQEQYDVFGQQIRDNLPELIECKKKSETILMILQSSQSLTEFVIKFQIYSEYVAFVKEEQKKKLGTISFLMDLLKNLDKE